MAYLNVRRMFGIVLFLLYFKSRWHCSEKAKISVLAKWFITLSLSVCKSSKITFGLN